MSVYIKLYCSFYDHPKTRRLKAAIGNDALWLLPRLWTFAAEYHPDGLLPYSAAELAQCVGFTGDATSMLQALLQARWLDDAPLRIHDWDEHNGYHKSYSDRAKAAAAARWGAVRKKEPKKEDTDKDRDKETSIASSMLQACFKHDRATKPTIEQIKLWMEKAGLPEIEADKFWDHYESNGWKVGRNPMKSLEATLRNWKRNFDQKRYANSRPNSQPHSRNTGTLNEGREADYANVGKV